MNIVQLAGCIIQDKKGRILLIHRNTPAITHWEIPGGKIDGGEDATHAAIRELQEELGVAVRIINKLGQGIFKHKDQDMNYHWFSATVVSGKPTIQEPHLHDDFAYFSKSQLDGMGSLSSNVQHFLEHLADGRIAL